MNTSDENGEIGKQGHRLDAAVGLVDKCVKCGAAVTVVLGLLYAFFFREAKPLRSCLLIAFFMSINTAAFGALLVSIREMSIGMRNGVTAGVVGTAIFFGSFGIVVFVFTAIMLKSLFL